MARNRKTNRPRGGSPSPAVDRAPPDPRPAASIELRHIQVTKKKIGGDGGRTHVYDDRLQVVAKPQSPDEVSRETAALLVEKGLAIDIDGKLQVDIAKARGEAAAKNNTVLQKQRSVTEMSRFDAMDADDRARLRDHNPDEGEDIIDD